MVQRGVGVQISFQNEEYDAIRRAVRQDAKNPPKEGRAVKSTHIKQHIKRLLRNYLKAEGHYEPEPLPESFDVDDLGDLNDEQREQLRQRLDEDQ